MNYTFLEFTLIIVSISLVIAVVLGIKGKQKKPTQKLLYHFSLSQLIKESTKILVEEKLNNGNYLIVYVKRDKLVIEYTDTEKIPFNVKNPMPPY